jgi:hypothetical protein
MTLVPSATRSATAEPVVTVEPNCLTAEFRPAGKGAACFLRAAQAGWSGRVRTSDRVVATMRFLRPDRGL